MADYLDQVIKQGSIEVRFQDRTPVDYLLDCHKCGEEPSYIIRIRVKNLATNAVLANYEREFPSLPQRTHYHNFVRKFLKDPVYRQQYLVSGQWAGSLTFHAQSGQEINPTCYKAIKRLNRKKGKIKFKELMQLRTGGRDSYSGKSLAQLKGLVKPESYKRVMEEKLDGEMSKSCLRWIARGLKVELAIRKVKVDKEVQENAERGRNDKSWFE
ncbi:MAG: hypothetical protein ACXAEU_03085 [Candidatus Hodarchaeales archaeon]|jgi:hypothetical protein